MTLENFNYRTDPLFLRNQFDSANSFEYSGYSETRIHRR